MKRFMMAAFVAAFFMPGSAIGQFIAIDNNSGWGTSEKPLQSPTVINASGFHPDCGLDNPPCSWEWKVEMLSGRYCPDNFGQMFFGSEGAMQYNVGSLSTDAVFRVTMSVNGEPTSKLAYLSSADSCPGEAPEEPPEPDEPIDEPTEIDCAEVNCELCEQVITMPGCNECCTDAPPEPDEPDEPEPEKPGELRHVCTDVVRTVPGADSGVIVRPIEKATVRIDVYGNPQDWSQDAHQLTCDMCSKDLEIGAHTAPVFMFKGDWEVAPDSFEVWSDSEIDCWAVWVVKDPALCNGLKDLGKKLGVDEVVCDPSLRFAGFKGQKRVIE